MLKIGVVEDNISEMKPLLDFLDGYFKGKGIEQNTISFISSESFLADDNFDYDILFLDIELPGKNGMDLARTYREKNKKTIIVFVTNMAQYAINGYEVEAYDFIVKPIKPGILSIKLDRILEKLSLSSNDKVVISIDRRPTVFVYDSIMFIETSNHNITINTSDGKVYKARASLSSLEKDFVSHGFYRVSSYALVNLKYVTGIDHDDVMVEDNTVRVSRPKKKDFMQALSNYLGRN